MPTNTCVATKAGDCGVRTFTASQIGSLIALPIGSLLFLLETRLDGLDLQFWVLYLATFAYYTITAWRTEEDLFLELQQMNKFRWAEWIIRVMQTALLGAAAAGVPTSLTSHLWVNISRIEASCLVLAFLYASCLLWDLLALAGGAAVMLKVLILDFVGGSLVLLFLWFHNSQTPAAYLFIMISAFLTPIQIGRGERWKRILQRDNLR